MAEPTPLVSNDAFRGSQAYHQFSFKQSQIRRNPPPNPPPRPHSTSSQRFSFHLPQRNPQPSQLYTQHIQIPIRVVVAGSTGDPLSAPVLQQNTVPVSSAPVLQHNTVPVFTKVGVVLSSPLDEPSSPRPPFKNTHPPLKRLSTSYRPPTRPSASTPPPVQRFVHFKPPLPEQPPPYEQIFDVGGEEESSEPIECPSVLASGSPRKEKKRSLRSRLLRHLTGKRAAAQQAHGSSSMTSGSQRAKEHASSPMVEQRNGQLIAYLQMPPATINSNVHVVQSGLSPHLSPRQVPIDGRYLHINGQTEFQQLTVIPQNGLIVDRSQLLETPTSPNLQAANQVIILHTVPEEDVLEEPSTVTTINTSSHTTVTVTTSVKSSSQQSVPISSAHSLPVSSVYSLPVSKVHSVPTFSVHSPPTFSVHSPPTFSVHSLPTSSAHNISSPGASQATRLSSPTPSSVFIPDQTSSEQHTSRHKTRASKSSVYSSEWSQGKVPQARPVYTSSSSNKNSQVISGKNNNSRDSSVHSQAESTRERPVTPPGHKPGSYHRKENDHLRKKKLVTETHVEIDDSSQTKSYTINLKPGMYKLNLNFPGNKRGSPAQTININVPTSDGKCSPSPQVLGKPPPVPEPLYYDNSKYSLPQRFVHMLKPSSLGSSRTQNSRNSPKVTIIQPSVDNNGANVITVLSPGKKHQQVIQHEPSSGHKRGGGGGGGCGYAARSQKKERYRWAPFPCVHVSSSGLEETVSEASGCDSWQGYEGVEHLKRQSECQKVVPYRPKVQETMACELCREELQAKVFDSGVISYYNEQNVSCDGCSDSCVLCTKSSKDEHHESAVPRIKSANETIKNDNHVFYPKLQKKWLEDEVFLRKVVAEYFMDPISGCDSETTCDDSTIDCSGKDLDSCSNDENSMVDGEVVVRKSEESRVKTVEKCDSSYIENSFDDSFYCETDETISSLFSDDSLGYDGDVEDVENMKWYENLCETDFDDCDRACTRVLNSIKQIEARGGASFSRTRSAPAHRAQCEAEVAWVDSPVKNLGKRPVSSNAAAAPNPSAVTAGGRSVRLPQPTEICQEWRGEEMRATPLGIDTVAGEEGPSSAGGGGGNAASATLETCHQSHAGCCCDGGVSAVRRVRSNTIFSENKVCSELLANDDPNRGLNLGLQKVKPLKLQKFSSSVLSSRSPSFKSSVTGSGDSLCSKCRKQTANSVAHEFAAALDDFTNSEDNGLNCSDSASDDFVTNEALSCGLVFERSNGRSVPHKFDLLSALESIRQLECKEHSSSQSSLSDSVFGEIHSYNRSFLDSEESMADVDLDANILQSYYNSNFVDREKRFSDGSKVSNASYANIDEVESPGIKNIPDKAITPPRLQMRRPPKPPKTHRNNDDHRYESFEFSSSYCNQRVGAPPGFNEREPFVFDAGRTPGLVILSGNSTDEEQKHAEVARLKPGRKRFAKAFQKAVVQIPVSASSDNPTTPPVETLKSELLIDPIYPRSTTVSLEQSITPSSGTTCISEYKIGETPTPDIKSNNVSTANNYTHFDTSSSDTDSKRSGKSKKNKKSKPRKYFSGILDAIGNAAPIFRTSLVTSSSSVDDRDSFNETLPFNAPSTPHKSDSSLRAWNVSSEPIDRTTSSGISGLLTQSPHKQTQEMSSRTDVTFSKRVSSPRLVGDPENNFAAGAVASSAPNASNHWRAAYLGHVGCDSPPMIPNHAGDEKEERNIRGSYNSYAGIKKNFDKKSDPVNKNAFKYDEMMYENVVFHKNLKKIPKFDVDLNDSDGSDPTNVTTTATITLNCNNIGKLSTDFGEAEVTVENHKPRSQSPSPPQAIDTCTVSASFSLSNLHYEDWCSAIGDQEDINSPDSENEQSFDKRSESLESLHSEASSFYYTAGANTIYEAVKSVRKSFANEFDDSENDEVNDINTDFDSSDEVTYNTTANEKIFMSTDDEFMEDRTIGGSSPSNSAGSDLMEQLNELHEKYFGKSPNKAEDIHTKREQSQQCLNLPRTSNQKRLNSSAQFIEGMVHAVPCVVLTDSDSQNDSGNSSKRKSKHDKSKLPAVAKCENSYRPCRSQLEKDDAQNDEESEVSEELDKRISGIWTTGTGGDADDESGGENSESTNSGSKSEQFFNVRQNDLTRNNYPADCKAPFTYGSPEYWNYYNGQCEFSCDPKYQNSGNYWCNVNGSCLNCNNTYENSPVVACCENNHQENECYRYKKHEEPVQVINDECSELPEGSRFHGHLGSSHVRNESTNVSFDEHKILDNKSGNNYAADSDLSISFDSIDNEDGRDQSKLEGSQSRSRDFLDVPDNESSENWARPYRDARLEDPNRSSLLDDVITCLAGKWKVSSSSAPPSPGSGTPRTETAKPSDGGPVRSGSYRSSRSGKPPVSPGSRTRDGGFAARASSSRPQSFRRRSRSASAGAKLRGAGNSGVARPASFVGLPRPTSMSDMVPGTAAYSASQESLHSISLMTSLDDLAPHPQWLAERKKAEGNEAYRNKEYRDALQHYTQAIDLCPDSAAYYSNRSACYMMLAKYRDALNDAQRAVTLDKTFVKGWLRVGKCHIALGDGGAALSVLRQAQELEPSNTALLQEMTTAQALQKCIEECAKAVDKKDYRTAVFHIDQALRYALGGLELRINKAEYLTLLGRLSDAEDIVNEILVSDNKHADAVYVRGLCRYYQDNQDAAFQHFQNVLRLVPDHSKAKDTYKRAKMLIQKKEQGNAAFKMGEFARAMEIYTEALEIDERNKSTNSKLYCNRATVAAKLGKLEQSITDCTLALNLDDGYIKAYLRRANSYQQTEQYEEAVRDLEKVYRLQRTQEHKRMLQEAKAQLKRSKRKDYYKILGVSKTATDDEIKKAYRKMALLHHPDRHSSASASEKAEHEKKFKELGEAYAVLTDPKKRAMHDRGQDVNDPECGFSRDANFDPNQVFEAFFGPDFFQSQSSHHHYYDQGQPHQPQFQGQFQGQHPGFQGFPGMPGGFQFEF